MSREDLHRTLDELHRQLESTDAIDAEARRHLQGAMDDIRAALTKAAADAAPEAGVAERLQQSVVHFEEDHPTLTRALLDLVGALRRAGF